ncbi:putative O-methyltransferase YrrM [Paenibacillus castaneae]|uniref:class I SAM-dependent methyltransferase n=1 Tax=Paenibacillus castaneae TaxID=474957 RepID=UPI001ABAFABC|nr:class I SAM-dependent methyltransferase [Paenibacillus castaneae]NIK78353.1 putative O-methyltransferase YrrM [Paenibacillus castaneae]
MSKWRIKNPIFESDQLNSKLRVAPWEGHRKFAYDFVEYLKPVRIVELGSHYGCSLFSFAQSIKDHKLETELYAVDTWGGDEQAGYYGEEVIGLVSETVSKYFNDINVNLLRKTFDDALSDFDDDSVDIIHIDGLHTYEAVKHDFTTWLPKLNRNGIILFHDVHSPLEYGSNQFWQEIKSLYPHYEFTHSWGLGMLFPKGRDIYEKLEHENFKDIALIYEYKALFEFEKIKNNDLSDMVKDRDELITKNEKNISNLNNTIIDIEKLVSEKDIALKATERLVVERDVALKATERLVDDRDVALKATEKLVIERDIALAAVEKLVIERDEELEKVNSRLSAELEKLSYLENELNKLNAKNTEQCELINYYKSKKIIINFKKK